MKISQDPNTRVVSFGKEHIKADNPQSVFLTKNISNPPENQDIDVDFLADLDNDDFVMMGKNKDGIPIIKKKNII